MNRLISILFAALCFLAPSLASAADLDQARGSLTSGNYDQAFSQAQFIGDIAGTLLAIEALNTKILIGQSTNLKGDAKLAMKLSNQVLELDPDNKDAKLLYAIAYGFYGRDASPFKAWRKKLPQKIRAAIDQAYVANPDEAHAYALIGAWHLSISVRAGAKTAKKMYGATEEQGILFYKRALERSPKDILISGNYAFMLYAADPERHRDEVDRVFNDVRDAEPKDAAERYVLSLINEIHGQLDQPKIAQPKAEAFLGW